MVKVLNLPNPSVRFVDGNGQGIFISLHIYFSVKKYKIYFNSSTTIKTETCIKAPSNMYKPDIICFLSLNLILSCVNNTQ